jgi:hypothetical protein
LHPARSRSFATKFDYTTQKIFKLQIIEGRAGRLCCGTLVRRTSLWASCFNSPSCYPSSHLVAAILAVEQAQQGGPTPEQPNARITRGAGAALSSKNNFINASSGGAMQRRQRHYHSQCNRGHHQHHHEQ